MTFSVRVELQGKDGSVSLYLKCFKTEPKDLRDAGLLCKYSLNIGNDRLPTLVKAEGTKTFTSIGWGTPEFISLESLRNRRRDLLQDGKLRVRVTMTILEKANALNFISVSSTATTGANLTAQGGSKTFDTFLETLRNDTEFSDVTFRCGSEEVKAHMHVLAYRFKVLYKMFTTAMHEATSRVVQIDDMDPSTLKIILHYMYTGKVSELDSDAALAVIYGAEKYGLDELKNFCFGKLVECISDENVGALAVAAHLYRAQLEVVKTIQEYLNRDFVGKVKENEGLRRLVKQYGDAFF